MLLWTINQLMHMTRDELCNLDESLRCAHFKFEAGTAQRHDLLTSLVNIRRVMILRGFHF